MEELQKVKAEKVTLMIHGEEREIRYNFSVWAKLEEELGSIKNIEEELQKQLQERPFKTLPHLFYLGLINKEGVSEETILDDYVLGDLQELIEKFGLLFSGSLPVGEESKKAEMEAENSLGLTS